MKRKMFVATMVFAMLAAGLAFAGEGHAHKHGKTHDLTVEVVAVDLEENTLTIKDEHGKEMTAPVLAAARANLKTVKAGQKVTITCQDDEDGSHEGVSAIKVALAKK